MQSPQANTSGRVVSIPSLTTTPRPHSAPASCSSLLSARIPQDRMTRSAGNDSVCSPISALTHAVRPLSPASIVIFFALVRQTMPSFSSLVRKISALSSSRNLPSSFGASSRTETDSPEAFSSPASSTPITPPPITTALCASALSRWMFFISSMVRRVWTPGSSAPGIGGIAALAPAA